MSVLMVAGLPDDQRIEAWTTDQNIKVFPKPFAPAELVVQVREVLEAGSAMPIVQRGPELL